MERGYPDRDNIQRVIQRGYLETRWDRRNGAFCQRSPQGKEVERTNTSTYLSSLPLFSSSSPFTKLTASSVEALGDIPKRLLLQRHLHIHVYCGTIHNSQVMETAKMPHH
jgi:hypothetical protein